MPFSTYALVLYSSTYLAYRCDSYLILARRYAFCKEVMRLKSVRNEGVESVGGFEERPYYFVRNRNTTEQLFGNLFSLTSLTTSIPWHT
jgi:hypothetical protein